MRRIIKVWCYNNRDEFRFYINISVPIFSLKTKAKTEKEKKRQREILDKRIDIIMIKKIIEEIKKAKAKFYGSCYGASWGSIKFARCNNKTFKL